jgi:hypothetical protein
LPMYGFDWTSEGVKGGRLNLSSGSVKWVE